MKSSELAVHASRLTKIYGTGREAVTILDSVDIAVPRGRFAAVMGPSGSGKSTLMHCLAGLERPSAGHITLGGTSMLGLDDDALSDLRRDRIGFIFQSYQLLPALTVEENVLLPFELASRKPDRDFAHEVIELFGLGARRDHLPGKLSGGQRQRVAAARALVLKPDVVFADEPTAALDPPTADEMIKLLRSCVRRFGQTVIMVTHDPEAAAQTDEVLFFENGRIATELRSPTTSQVLSRLDALSRRRRLHLEGVLS